MSPTQLLGIVLIAPLIGFCIGMFLDLLSDGEVTIKGVLKAYFYIAFGLFIVGYSVIGLALLIGGK